MPYPLQHVIFVVSVALRFPLLRTIVVDGESFEKITRLVKGWLIRGSGLRAWLCMCPDGLAVGT